MLILAAVPDIQLLNLRRAAAARFTLARAGSWAEALSTIRTRPVELAVVDPLLSGEPRTREIERLRVLFPSLPLVLYTTLTPRTAGVLLTLGQRGIENVIIARYDDHPLRLREVLAEEEAHSASRLLRTSWPTRWRLCRASCAGCSRRRCDRRPACRRWARWPRAPAWTAAPASAGSRAWGSPRPASSSPRPACCTPTGCSRTRASRSKTSRSASATPRRRRCSSTPAAILDSRRARCGCH